MKKSIILLFSVISIVACKKEDPKPSEPFIEPKFQYYWIQKLGDKGCTFNATGCLTEKEMKDIIIADSAYNVIKSARCN